LRDSIKATNEDILQAVNRWSQISKYI